jgi:hypothetical protein
MLRKSCHRTLNNSKITAGGPCIPHPLGWGAARNLILFIALVIILVGDYVIFATDSFFGSLLILMGIVIAVFGTLILLQYFTNWIEKSSSFIPISKYFSVKCLKS